MSTTLSNTAADLAWFLDRARPSLRRSMRRFAEEEIVIPDGPFEGRKFSCARQPYTGLWFDAVDSGLWPRCVATGPTQSGKTLASFVIPLLYHLFEIGETTICGLPDMDMAADKWREDILPAIERSRYRDLLPTRGGGSRGGRVESIQFLNGATLKFMSGGGGDKSRAGFTSRVVVITETDGMDEAGMRSRESDKITQLEARTRAYGCAEADLHGVHGLDRAGPHVDRVPARHPQPDRPALSALRPVGGPRTRTPGRLAIGRQPGRSPPERSVRLAPLKSAGPHGRPGLAVAGYTPDGVAAVTVVIFVFPRLSSR